MRRAVHGLDDGAFLLEALVRLHAGRHLVLVIDLDDAYFVAFHAALAVHERNVVVVAGAEERSHRLGCAGAIALQAEYQLFVLSAGRTHG